jgi:hypothetical protein
METGVGESAGTNRLGNENERVLQNGGRQHHSHHHGKARVDRAGIGEPVHGSKFQAREPGMGAQRT